MKCISIIGLLFFFLISFPVNATEPCPPHPCLNSSGKFLESECRKASDWIATGSITDVKRDRKGYPLNKDFASFVFNPKSWKKVKKKM